MDLRWLRLDAITNASKRPSWQSGLGLVALGLSAFAWPLFPPIEGRTAFASMFSIGSTAIAATIGAQLDGRVKRARGRRRRR